MEGGRPRWHQMERRRSREGDKMKRGKLLVVPAMGWLTLFFALPLLIVVVVSFASRTAYGQVVFD